MHIDKLEKFWIWLTTITAFAATAVIGFYALELRNDGYSWICFRSAR